MTKFKLQPYKSPSSRYRCPQCNHRDKTFVRYISTETGDHLADHVGRCGREDKCGYHYKPRDYFRDNAGMKPLPGANNKRKPGSYPKKPKPASRLIKPHDPQSGFHINPDIVNASFNGYEQNNFVLYLISKFGRQAASDLIGRYRIGTSKHWHGATVFWQLDYLGRARTGKVMLYNSQTGKRVKQPFAHITWVHTLLVGCKNLVVDGIEFDVNSRDLIAANANCQPQTAGFHVEQCLFGEHLLTENPALPVAIVESEKTAVIASYHAPGMVWLAAGSLGNLNPELCHALHHRSVTLYPDLGAYAKWCVKAKQLQAAIPGSVFT
ncbi:MAG: DUF6371 domain-containing protein, partial [Sphingobacteriales bacterium]